MKMAGVKLSTRDMLLGIIADYTQALWYAQTDRKKAPPQSIMDVLLNGVKKPTEKEIETFRTGEDFLKRRKQLLDRKEE